MSANMVSVNEESLESDLRELVRKTIEETINAMLDEEADRLVGAGPYERTDERAAYRAGHYERGFTTTSGQVTLKIPKLKGMRFATAVVERYKRRNSSRAWRWPLSHVESLRSVAAHQPVIPGLQASTSSRASPYS